MKVQETKSSIAIIGSRGIPNNYGGFEGFTETVSERLVKEGFKVYVSCEHPGERSCPDTYNDVNLFYFPIKHPKSSFMGMMYEIIYDIYSLFWVSIRVDSDIYARIFCSFILFHTQIIR